jgi:hypothetical protein
MARDKKTVQPKPSHGERDAPADESKDCRCKATSEMKPRQLLKLMMSDLLFWKRPGKG